MPLYLCQPGRDKPEPWRHGVNVFATPSVTGRPIRRLRHGEIVLVDDVCFTMNKHWLRLRWPGRKGGFAGYLQLDDEVCADSNANVDGSCKYFCYFRNENKKKLAIVLVFVRALFLIPFWYSLQNFSKR